MSRGIRNYSQSICALAFLLGLNGCDKSSEDSAETGSTDGGEGQAQAEESGGGAEDSQGNDEGGGGMESGANESGQTNTDGSGGASSQGEADTNADSSGGAEGDSSMESSPTTDGDDSGMNDDSGMSDGETGEDPGEPDVCKTWVIEYDLTGSQFDIRDTPFGGAGDKSVKVQEPYDSQDNIGPGKMMVRFADVDGQPGGKTSIIDYQLKMNFSVSAVTVTVKNDLNVSSGPDECGKAQGDYADLQVTWDPTTLADYTSKGIVRCDGFGCPDGLPSGRDVEQDLQHDQTINPFVFEDDTLAKFTMSEVQIPNDQDGNTFIRWVGTEVSRELVDSPECACD